MSATYSLAVTPKALVDALVEVCANDFNDDDRDALRDIVAEFPDPEGAEDYEALAGELRAAIDEALGHLIAGNVDDLRRVLETHADGLEARALATHSSLHVPSFF